MNDNKLIFALVIGIIILFGVFMMISGRDDEAITEIVSQAPIQIPQPVPVVPAAPPTDEPVLEPVEELVVLTEETEPQLEIQSEPVEAPELELQPAPLPDLNDSDAFVLNSLAEIDGGSAVITHLVSEELIRKFVVLIENVSRGEFPDRNLPLQVPQQAMQVRELGSEFFLMDESSYRRFDASVNVLSNIDTETDGSYYKHKFPLFSQAYAEMGIPDSEFDEVLITAIDQVLNARSAPQPQQLIRPSLNYLYADPEVENFTDVEKLLMRLGPGNTQSLQRRLEFFKRRLQLGSM